MQRDAAYTLHQTSTQVEFRYFLEENHTANRTANHTHHCSTPLQYSIIQHHYTRLLQQNSALIFLKLKTKNYAARRGDHFKPGFYTRRICTYGCSRQGQVCVAVRCSTLQCAAVCCSVLQCVHMMNLPLRLFSARAGVYCSVLQCVALCCSMF